MLSRIVEILIAVAVVFAVAPPPQVAPPSSAATPALSAAAEADAYLAEIRPALSRLGTGGDSMAGLMAAPALSDPQWRADAGAAFAAIRAAHAALLEVQPSPRMVGVHAVMTAGTEQCSRGAQEAQAAIANDSVLGLYAAAQLFQACGEGIAAANAMIAAMRE